MTFRQDREYDLNRIIARPLYFGLFVNVLVPMGLLMLCYLLNKRSMVESRVDFATANTLRWVFLALAALQTGVAVWLRTRIYHSPMIRRRETFEDDFADEYLRRTRPLFLLIAAISLWGIINFFLTARFEDMLIFIVFSFLVFQLVRPRFGLVQRLIERQEAMVEKGQFLRD